MATSKTVKKADTKVDVVAKAAPAKEVVAKAAPAKEVAAKAAPVKAAPVKEAPAKKAPTKEAAAKKAPAKKAPAKKEVKTTLFVQYLGKEVSDADMVAAVKKAWTASGNKVGDIKTMTLYVKPEEAAVYYVINGTETGKVEF